MTEYRRYNIYCSLSNHNKYITFSYILINVGVRIIIDDRTYNNNTILNTILDYLNYIYITT